MKGTISTEKIIGAAAVKLTNAVKSLNEMHTETVKLVDLIQEQTVQVTDLEGKISQLSSNYEKSLKEQQFELDLAYRTDKARFAKEWLTTNNMIPVEKPEYEKLENSYKNLKSEFQSKIDKETEEIRTQLQKDFNQQAIINKADFERKEAQNIAEITQLKAQLASASATAEMWKEQLIAERQASVERAKASAIGAVNVSAAK